MILIKNGYIIDPASGFEDYADIVIEDGIIKKIGCLDGDYDNAASQNNNQSNSNDKNNKTSDSNYEQVIDAKGMIVAPGLVDTHVHFMPQIKGLNFNEKDAFILEKSEIRCISTMFRRPTCRCCSK